MLVLNLPFKALMFLTLMRPSLVLVLLLWLKLVKDFLKVRCRLALLPFLISCLIWRSEERRVGKDARGGFGELGGVEKGTRSTDTSPTVQQALADSVQLLI